MSLVTLEVTLREQTGTGSAREARRNGLVPGVLYGGGQDPVSVTMKYNEVFKAINSGNFIASMVELSHDGKKQKVITKDIQFHPVSDQAMHVDFYRVKENTIIEVEVSVNFIGEDVSPGLKEGGTLNVVRYAIEVKCPAGSIPDTIDVDVSKMEVGDSIHISEIDLPKGVTPTIDDRDFTIATIVASRAAVEETEESEEETEVAADEVPAAEQKDED